MIKFYPTLFSPLFIEYFLEQGTLENREMKNNPALNFEKQNSPLRLYCCSQSVAREHHKHQRGLVRNVNSWSQLYLVKQKLCLNKPPEEAVLKSPLGDSYEH